MPAHFQLTRRSEADQQRAISLFFYDLGRVENETACMGGGVRRKAPDNVAVFGGIFECAEPSCGMLADIEASVEHAALRQHFRSEERRGGKEQVTTCKSWWLPFPLQKQQPY